MVTVRQVEARLLAGDSNWLRNRRRAILSASRRTTGDDRIRMQSVAASQYLAMIDVRGAAAALAPYAVMANGRIVRSDELEAEGLSEASKARVLIQVANLMYRNLQFAEGLGLARQAVSLVESSEPARGGTLGYVLDWTEAAIWEGRLRWRARRDRRVTDRLASVVHVLENTYGSSSEGISAITLHLAVALELWAAIDWLDGQVSAARTKIYRSLFLHRDVSDSVRGAYALYEAARIEYSHEGSRFTWAEHLASRAESALLELKHPFSWRATNLRARCLLRRDRIQDARECVKLAIPRSNATGPERSYALGERRLTSAWIAEEVGDWDTVLKHTQAIIDRRADLPYRVSAEAHLRRGVARSNLGDMSGAQEDFRSCRSEAGKKLPKTLVACILAEAESFIRHDRPGQAHACLREADALLQRVESVFLRERRARVAKRIEGDVPVPVAGSYTDARKSLRRLYYTYHVERSSSVRDLLQRTGLDKKTYQEMRREYGFGVRDTSAGDRDEED